LAKARGNFGESRASAHWGGRVGQSRSRAVVVLAIAAAALTVPFAAIADDREQNAFVEASLLTTAERNPDALFRVIVQGSDGQTTAGVADEIVERLDDNSRAAGELTGRFQSVTGVAATLTGDQVLDLARDGAVEAITRDVAMVPSDDDDWRAAVGLEAPRGATKRMARFLPTPTIAIVDSGIEASRADFAGRVVAQVSMTQLQPNSAGDGRGHGTFVSGLAAGGSRRYPGAAPNSDLVAIDVIDDRGMAMTSDVIAAADWILQNKDRYRIRVANFSLHAGRPSSFRMDPLDRAVERLWFSGVVVVASAGNYATGGAESGVPFAPANDPFVITVGATDLGMLPGSDDDDSAPWSAYGRTPDGFLKPEVGAPGRKLIGPVPVGSTMALDHPERVVARGYMRMSGTSFAAPIVAGAAAQLLGRHPNWTPDDVKGALMVSAEPLGDDDDNNKSAGAGQIDVKAAQRVADPPNPNRALNRFLIDDPAAGSLPVFDAASWDSAVKTDASWDSASWSDASWSDASWDSASWADFSWSDASWADASWADASWADVSWADASWVD
jgi:serine protease AprX